MRRTNMYEVLDSFSKSGRHVFTTYELAKTIRKPVAYASLMLHKNRHVAKIERGKYFIEGATPYEIASNITFPSYVSLQAGFQYYGLIEQNVVNYSVITLKRHNLLDMGMFKIEFIKTKRELLFGYERKGNEYVARPEKLFIDAFYFGKVPEQLLKNAFVTANEEKLLDLNLLKQYLSEIKGARGYQTISRNISKLLDLVN